MNNKHILDLTLRLSQALDQNYDVVNMETVVSVISALEGTTINKEQLEATRLAKYINQLRRRTKCDSLARRAKSLLKRWREMVGMQQTNDITATSVVGCVPPSTAISSSNTANTPFSIPVTDNAVSNSQLANPQFSQQQFQIQQHYHSNIPQHQNQQQLLYRSEPSSPVNLQEKYNPNEFLNSISNPATGPQVPKSSNSNQRKKRKLDKNTKNDTITQQPTSFANLITGLGNTYASSRKSTREVAEPVAFIAKPMETFVIEHSSNSNSDLICLPSHNTVGSNFTSATNVPPVIIDLQDTNSSMNSLMSKDVTNVSSSIYKNKVSTKKSKKEKKRKDRNAVLRNNQTLQDCDEQNATTTTCQHKQVSNVLLLDEKSHSACPTISNISEILSLSNSSISSVFPSVDAISKNIFQSGQNDLSSPSVKMSKSDLTFAGKFKQNTSSTSTGCNVLDYNSDSLNTNVLSSNSLNQNKFSVFGGIGNNSNDSSSSSRTSSFHDVVYAAKIEASNSLQNIDFGIIKHVVNEKSMSNISNKDNSSTDNTIAAGASTVTQQQKSVDLTKEFSSQKIIKTPKKRGRKKGSKGVDSVIAKETSLSSQMLLAPLGVAGKKVKTTKELYTEMENRKLRNAKALGEQHLSSTNMIVQQQLQQQQKPAISRCPSISDIADSDSCTMTSEPSRDSGNIVNKTTKGKQLDNNSNYSKHESELKAGEIKDEENRLLADKSSVLEVTTKIKLEIQEILKLMTPPPTVKEIEYECFNSITPCTCAIEEITVRPENETIAGFKDSYSKDLKLNDANSTNMTKKDIKNSRISNAQTVSVCENIDRGQNEVPPLLPAPVKIKKSIFDLDFDDDDDPLNSIIADIVSKSVKADKETKVVSPEAIDKFELPTKDEDDLGKADYQNELFTLNATTSNMDYVVFPSYEIKFDPNCQAKNRFEIQTQKITKFHVDALHNCYIPNINGNWNHASTIQICKYIKDEDNFEELNSIVDGYDVVPLYGSDINEQIAKDLSHVQFSRNFQIKHCKRQNSNEVLFNIPFFGVSRILDNDDTKLSSKDLKMVTSDDEKENVDYKFNLENILLNESALDIDDAKEKFEADVKDEQIVEKSVNTRKSKSNKNFRKASFKRTKEHATLVKKSTIKRLKLTEYDIPESKTSKSNDSDDSNELKLHSRLFYHEELCSADRKSNSLSNECIFHISSCSSECSSVEGNEANYSPNCRTRVNSTSSSSGSVNNVSSLQQKIIQLELKKLAECPIEKDNQNVYGYEAENKISACCDNDNDNYLINSDEHDLPKENNRMLLSFNNIYNKSTRDENAERQNKNDENKMLKQQLQNCDDYKHLNGNFNLIKYIDNKNNSVNNINNNNNSCSNNNSDINVNISSSSSENPSNPALIHHRNNNDNDVQIRTFKEYQTGMRAVDEDVKDDDGNNCGRLQQFKEWHEVLQLSSYNDELLTVLPYVVLE